MRYPFWVVVLAFVAPVFAGEVWPQFRGANGAGVSESVNLPAEFGPASNLVWKTALPAGKSSPVVAGDRIFLTGHDGDRLLTLAYDRKTGRKLWRREIARQRTAKRHKLNDAAAPTPVTDGRNVYVLFADFGLVSYSAKGRQRWLLPLDGMENMHGIAASPILAGTRLVLVSDQARGAYVTAVDSRTGKVLWRTERGPAPGGGYSTPVAYTGADGRLQVVTLGPYELAGYDAANGEKLWWVKGLSWQPKPSLSVAGDTIYCAALGFAAEQGAELPSFANAAAGMDKDKDGKIAHAEAQPKQFQDNFGMVDTNRDGYVDEAEWNALLDTLRGDSVMMAVRPSGRGDLTRSAVLWRYGKGIPDVPSPLRFGDTVYLVRNGGVMTALDAATGAVRKQGRIRDALGEYYASPVAADGKVFTLNQAGKLAVIKAGPEWEVLAVNDLGEDCYATPAIADGRIYVRTHSTLYCFAAGAGPGKQATIARR